MCPSCGQQPPTRDDFLVFAPSLAEEGDGFSPDYFQVLAANEKGNFWFENRNRLIEWALRKYFPTCCSFLEIGCGTGFVLSYLRSTHSDISFTGSEIFLTGLRFASGRLSGVQLLQMDARHIPFEDEFDVIGAFDVLEHIEEDEAVLSEMYRSVKPGGGILVTVPQHRWLWSRVDEISFHKRRYSNRELRNKVQEAGFEVVRSTSFVSFLLPLMGATRLRKKKGRVDIDEEYKISAVVNKMLSSIMSLEARAIRAGFRFPAGGSLLLIAKKPTATSP
jgi:SAM-dependent methyltransferase